MTPSSRLLLLIEEFEDLRLSAYKDTGGVWTIGIGTIEYPWGKKVGPHDICTKEQAYEYLQHDLRWATKTVNTYAPGLTQNQFNALVSFTYNVGAGAFKSSTLLKKVIANPADPEIRVQFLRWNKDNGRVVKGLTNRRKREAELYFS